MKKILFLIALAVLASCGKDDPQPVEYMDETGKVCTYFPSSDQVACEYRHPGGSYPTRPSPYGRG